MHRLFLPPQTVASAVEITGEDCRHLQVLRVRQGETLSVSDGVSWLYDGRVERVEKDRVLLSLSGQRPLEGEPSLRVVLWQAVCKGDKNEQIVQKCVELGVDAVRFFCSENCVARPSGREDAKIFRLARVSRMAAMQAGRGRIPEVDGFFPFDAMREACAGAPSLFFYENAVERLSSHLAQHPFGGKTCNIIIGSEGGFTPREAECLVSAGIPALSLGSRILRAETAPAAVLAVLMASVGEL